MRPNVYSADTIALFLQVTGMSPDLARVEAEASARRQLENHTSFRALYRNLGRRLRRQRPRDSESPDHRALLQFLTGGLEAAPTQVPSIPDLTAQLEPGYAVFGPVARVQNTCLAISLKAGLFGAESLFRDLEDRWNRRHDLPVQSSKTKAPKQRHALTRLLVALLRFALGFFGSHKVDARNNP